MRSWAAVSAVLAGLATLGISCGEGDTVDSVDAARGLTDVLDGLAVDAPAGAEFVRVSPEGNALAYLAVGADTALVVVDGDGQRRITGEGVDVESFDWLREDCGWIVAIQNQAQPGSRLERISCDGTREEMTVELPRGRSSTRGLAVLSEGDMVVAVGARREFETPTQLIELDGETGAVRELTSGPTTEDHDPIAIPGRRAVVFTRGVVDQQAARIGVLDLESREIEWLTGEGWVSSQAAISANGRLVAFDAFTRTKNDRATWVIPIEGGEPTLVDEDGNAHPVIVGTNVALQRQRSTRRIYTLLSLPDVGGGTGGQPPPE